MKVAILGYDVEGRVSYDYFLALGHQLEIRDRNPELAVPDGAAKVLGAGYLDNLDGFDLLMRTPGLPARLILEKNPGVAGKITSQLNEFLRVCPTKNVIGVTGTKGKGTTSTLIAKMLEATNKTVCLGGNIGVPPLTFLSELAVDSWVVLELSSFQLIDLTSSPRIAVCLMIAPEHLDWHSNKEEYFEAKSQLFRYQTDTDIAIYSSGNENSKHIASSGSGQKIPYMAPPGAVIQDSQVGIDGKTICRTDELKLLGQHNWQNVCAAVTAVWQVTQDIKAMRSVLTSFSGLEHRLELIRELDSVRYYDDSFGTTPETAIVAIEAFTGPKVIILGGSDKGADYGELAKTVHQQNVRKAVIIGEQGGRIQTALEQAGFTGCLPGGTTMSQIVATAQAQAQPGDIVLLSTACASFDMFKSYKDRGEQFSAAVRALV